MSANKKNFNRSLPTTQQTQTAVFQQTYQGPIPDPATLSAYNQIDNTFAERVMVMAEKEQTHRHEQNVVITAGNTELNKDNVNLVNRKLTNERLGTFIGFASVLVIAGICFYAFSLGYAVQAAAIACTVFVSLAGVFVLRKFVGDTKKDQDLVSENKRD